MAIFETFSKRQRRLARRDEPEVYDYEQIPAPLRVQIAYICSDALGRIGVNIDENIVQRWRLAHNIIAREKGVFSLGETRLYGFDEICINWMVKAKNKDDILDMVEVLFRIVERNVRADEESNLGFLGVKVTAKMAVEELNARFKENNVGYQYDNGDIIRVDSQYVHAEVVKPALLLLSGNEFLKANDDFRLAHEHYRGGKNKDCVVAAQRAFESTMKAICSRRSWDFKPTDRSSDLIKILRHKGLFPDYLGNGFESYIAMIKTGLPDLRNNAGGHGEHPEGKTVPNYIASYALHMTAANIVFLVDADKSA